ncbi:MAG: hypothetical protein DIU68_005245 [Chloroflexota bacterium]
MSQLTRCLWEFQEMTLEIEGLILISADRGVLASTVSESVAVNRVTAVVKTLIGLARQTSNWSPSQFNEYRVRYKDDAGNLRDAQLISVTDGIALVVILERQPTQNFAEPAAPFNTRQALHYVNRILRGENDPPNAMWL